MYFASTNGKHRPDPGEWAEIPPVSLLPNAPFAIKHLSPVGRLVFNTSEALTKCLVGSTPTSSATIIGE